MRCRLLQLQRERLSDCRSAWQLHKQSSWPPAKSCDPRSIRSRATNSVSRTASSSLQTVSGSHSATSSSWSACSSVLTACGVVQRSSNEASGHTSIAPSHGMSFAPAVTDCSVIRVSRMQLRSIVTCSRSPLLLTPLNSPQVHGPLIARMCLQRRPTRHCQASLRPTLREAMVKTPAKSTPPAGVAHPAAAGDKDPQARGAPQVRA